MEARLALQIKMGSKDQNLGRGQEGGGINSEGQKAQFCLAKTLPAEDIGGNADNRCINRQGGLLKK